MVAGSSGLCWAGSMPGASASLLLVLLVGGDDGENDEDDDSSRERGVGARRSGPVR